MSRYVHPTMFSLFTLTLLFSLAWHLLSPPDGNIGEVDGEVIDSREWRRGEWRVLQGQRIGEEATLVLRCRCAGRVRTVCLSSENICTR